MHANLVAGTYRMRVQYEEGNGGNTMYLLWDDAANSGGTVSGLYLVPVNQSPAIGTLTTGAVTCNSTSTLQVDLNGTIPTCDQLSSTGAVVCAGTLTNVSMLNPAVGKVYAIINAGSVSGTFFDLADTTVFTQQKRFYQISYGASAVTLTDVVRPTTRVWDGGSLVDNNWTTKENWNNDLAPIAGDDLQFGGSTRLTSNNDFAADTSFASITFNSGAGAFVIGGNRITLAGSVTNSGASLQTINLAMTMAATRTFAATSGDLALNGILSGAGGLTKTGAGTTLTITGIKN